MNSIIKISTFAAFFAVMFAVALFALSQTAFAIGGDAGGDGGGGGSIGDGCCNNTTKPKPTTPTPDTSTPSKQKPAVCVAFTFGGGATERTLPYGGGDVKLKWDTKNASSVSINNGIGSVSADGTKTVRVTKDTTFKLTAKGAGGNDTCKVYVKVADAPKPKPAQCDAFTISKTSLPYGGGDVKLSWNTTNASSVSIDQGIGSVSADGTKTVRVTGNKTFTLTAKSADGNDTCKVSVKVAAPSAASCDAFTVNKSNLPYGGGDVTLSWNTTNAKSVSINQGIGSVSADGSKTVRVTASKTFVLTAVGDGGNDDCQVSVKVGSPANLSCDLFTVSKSHVEEGESFTLRWQTTGADSVSINQGIGSVSADGDRTESVDDDTTYTLTAKRGNDEVTCTTYVKVKEDDDHDDDDDLSCELDISDDDIERGDSVKLSWETEGGDEILLKDNHGNVLVDTDDGDDYDVDEDDIRVKPTRDTEYRLTVFDGNDKETCKVDVDVDDKDVSVTSDRNQDTIIVGIPLTHVPYTGFEAGPVLTALFYTLLAAWAFGVAYILVVKKGKVFGFALPQKTAVAATVAGVSAPVYTPAVPATLSVKEEEHVISALDTKAHEARVLLSNDAREFLSAQRVTVEEQLALLDSVIANAKATFPTENGWVILNKARVESLI